MKDQLNKMLMEELLTDDQLKFYELTIKQFHNPHGTVNRHSTALLLGYRNLKSKVEEMQKALQFYAEPDTYCIEHLNQFGYIIIDKDNGEIARQALKGVETE